MYDVFWQQATEPSFEIAETLKHLDLDMARTRKLESPVTLFAAIEREQHEVLRSIAFSEHKSIADIAREALAQYIERHKSIKKPAIRTAYVASHRG